MGLNEVYPNSINENETCFLLEKGIYGLCHAVRQFWKKFVQEMNKLDFEISPADPCLLYHEDKSGNCMIIIYVNDMREIIEELNTIVEEVFSIKTEDNLTDYLGCEFHMWLGQPSIIKSLEKKFGKEAMKHRLG